MDQSKKPTNFIPDFMDEDTLFNHMEDRIGDQSSEEPSEITTDVTKLPFVQNLIRESKSYWYRRLISTFFIDEILKERLRYFTTSLYKELKDDALCTIAWHQIQQ